MKRIRRSLLLLAAGAVVAGGIYLIGQRSEVRSASKGPPDRPITQEYLQYYIGHFGEPGVVNIVIMASQDYHDPTKNGWTEAITLIYGTMPEIQGSSNQKVHYGARIVDANGLPAGYDPYTQDCTGDLWGNQYTDVVKAFLVKANEINWSYIWPDDRRTDLGFGYRNDLMSEQQWQDFLAATPGYSDIDIVLETLASPHYHPTMQYREVAAKWMLASPDDMGPNGNPDNQKLLDAYNILDPIFAAVRAACPVL